MGENPQFEGPSGFGSQRDVKILAVRPYIAGSFESWSTEPEHISSLCTLNNRSGGQARSWAASQKERLC